jgi:hypothetical protein
MFDNSNRDSLRQFYITSWQKSKNKLALNPLEQQIVAVIREHPEYHHFLDNTENALQQDFIPEMGESNPFLHMGMHIGLMEQISTNRPTGIREIYQKLSTKLGSHDAEHRMMDCLAEAIWTAQKNQQPPDDTAYFTCLKQLESLR